MLTYELDDKEIKRWMKQLYNTTNNLSPFFKHTAIPIMHSSAMKNFRQGGRPIRWRSLSPLTLANRKTSKHALGQDILQNIGTLRASIGSVRKITGESLEYGTNLIYAGMMQEGGTIYPKNVKYLTIPLPAATPGRGARSYENTFVAKGVIFQKVGKEIVPLFLLKEKVKIPGRPFMVWQEEDIYNIGRNLLMFIAEPEKYKILS